MSIFSGKLFIIVILFFFIITNIVKADDDDLAVRLKGKILIQTESNGEAWYVNPANLKRYYLGRPKEAFEIMEGLGVGISNNDLVKIQIAGVNLISGVDTDEDGLSDMFEDAVNTDKNKIDTDGDGLDDKKEILEGFNPLGAGELIFDNNFSAKNAGKIFLQVENNGEAWYVNGVNLKRYYLGRPSDAFSIMRSLGLGISNSDLEEISVNKSYNTLILKAMEKNIQKLVNQQRIENGIDVLKWNNDLADVAREHSNNLADENVDLINGNITCSLPMIHHEGFDFGLFAYDRLNARQIYYLNASGENIALVPTIHNTEFYYERERGADISDCGNFFNEINNNLKLSLENEDSETGKKKIVENEINYRADLVAKQSKINIIETDEKTADEIENEAVNGWMNSPGHRKNILTADYNEAGVGIAEMENYLIITQVFITRVECGYKTGICCEKEEYYPYCYKPYSCVDMICGE